MTRRNRGFTLIELLVVVSVIGILMGLLLPGLNAAREQGRRSICLNNLKQLGQACLGHVEKNGYFPTGGWGTSWVGLYDFANNGTKSQVCGSGQMQPGGWIYNVLPFLDQLSLHDLGRAGGTFSFNGVILSNGSASSAARLQTTLGVLYCPTRRRAQLYPMATGSQTPVLTARLTTQGVPNNYVCRSDYAINGGSIYVASGQGPSSYTSYSTYSFPNLTKLGFNGLSSTQSQVAAGQVVDGMSNTYLVGEKYVTFDYYTTGQDGGDQLYAMTGGDVEIVRWGATKWNGSPTDTGTVLAPIRDMSLSGGANQVPNSTQRFGSAHAAGWNVVFCDGNARTMSYSLDALTHEFLASRNDHQPIDPSKF